MFYVGRAYNRLTGEVMYKPKRPGYLEYAHLSEYMPAYYAYLSEMKKWEAFIAKLPAEAVWERPKLRHATQNEKGVPVRYAGYSRRRKYVNGSGVSANSRILPHRYADEGEKGKGHRREIRRRERAQWLSEWQQDQNRDAAYPMPVSLWFGEDLEIDHEL